VGDLAEVPVDQLVGVLGEASGRHLHALAHGIDDRPVVPDREPKSIGHEETFATDLHDPAALDRELVRLSDSVGTRLRRHGYAARTVTIKVRFHDFRTITRAVTLPEPVDTGPTITRAARTLLQSVDPSTGVRLLGVHGSALVRDAARQLTLDDLFEASEPSADDWGSASRAVDQIRDRFGAGAIGPASLTGPDGLRVKRGGEQPWGPGEPGSEEAQATADLADRKKSPGSR
jgi:DNA polymerase-4